MHIKKQPEDFVVREICDIKLSDEGKYYVYLLKKINRNTQEIIGDLQKKYATKIKYAGLKDKRAITFQYISSAKKLPEIKKKYFTLKYQGKTKSPISLGSNRGNKFEIYVQKKLTLPKQMCFPNYFGEQRFGKNNLPIAKAILERDWKRAVQVIDDINVESYLKNRPNDFVGALKVIPKKTLRLILSSYQSDYFNEKLSQELSGIKLKVGNNNLVFPKKCQYSDESIVLPGWDNGDNRFLVKQIPEISLEGVYRNMFAIADNVSLKDGWLHFSLTKGCYATIFLRQVFQEQVSEDV